MDQPSNESLQGSRRTTRTEQGPSSSTQDHSTPRTRRSAQREETSTDPAEEPRRPRSSPRLARLQQQQQEQAARQQADIEAERQSQMEALVQSADLDELLAIGEKRTRSRRTPTKSPTGKSGVTGTTEGDKSDQEVDEEAGAGRHKRVQGGHFPSHLGSSLLLASGRRRRTGEVATVSKQQEQRTKVTPLQEFVQAGLVELDRLERSDVSVGGDSLDSHPIRDLAGAGTGDTNKQQQVIGEVSLVDLAVQAKEVEQKSISSGPSVDVARVKTEAGKAASQIDVESLDLSQLPKWMELVRHYENDELDSDATSALGRLRMPSQWPRLAIQLERVLRVFDVLEEAAFALLARDKQVFVWLSDIQNYATDRAFRISITVDDIGRILAIFPESYKAETLRRTKLATSTSFEDVRLTPMVQRDSAPSQDRTSPAPPSIISDPFQSPVQPAPSLLEEGASASRMQSNLALCQALVNMKPKRYAALFFRCLLLVMRDHNQFIQNVIENDGANTSQVSVLTPMVTDTLMKTRGVAVAKALLPAARETEESLSLIVASDAAKFAKLTGISNEHLFKPGGLLANNRPSNNVLGPPKLTDWHFGYPVRTSLARMKPVAIPRAESSAKQFTKLSVQDILSNLKDQVHGDVNSKQIPRGDGNSVLPPSLPSPPPEERVPSKVWVWRSRCKGFWESDQLSTQFKLLLANVATCISDDGALALAPVRALQDVAACLKLIQERTGINVSRRYREGALLSETENPTSSTVYEIDDDNSDKSDDEGDSGDDDASANEEETEDEVESKYYASLPQDLKDRVMQRTKEKAREHAPEVVEAQEQLAKLSKLTDLLNRIRVTLVNHRAKGGYTASMATRGGGDMARMALDALITSLAQNTAAIQGQPNAYTSVTRREIEECIELLCTIATNEYLEVYQGLTVRILQMKMNARTGPLLNTLDKLCHLQKALIPKLIRLGEHELKKIKKESKKSVPESRKEENEESRQVIEQWNRAKSGASDKSEISATSAVDPKPSLLETVVSKLGLTAAVEKEIQMIMNLLQRGNSPTDPASPGDAIAVALGTVPKLESDSLVLKNESLAAGIKTDASQDQTAQHSTTPLQPSPIPLP